MTATTCRPGSTLTRSSLGNSRNGVDGAVHDVCLCSGMGGNMRCRKGSPCSTRARATMYPRPARLSLWAASPPKGSSSAKHCCGSSPPRMPHDHAGGTALHGAPRSRLRRARIVSTPCYYRKQHALTEKPPDFSGGFRHVLPGAVNGRRRAKIFFTPGRRLARRQIDRYYGVFVTISCSDMRFSVYVWNHWLQRTSACGSSSD